MRACQFRQQRHRFNEICSSIPRKEKMDEEEEEAGLLLPTVTATKTPLLLLSLYPDLISQSDKGK